MTTPAQLQLLSQLVGRWATEATHPDVPGTVVHGTTTMEWLQGEHFLISRSDTDHPQFPGAISIIGYMDEDRVDEHDDAAPSHAGDKPVQMQYFDSRGVFRVSEVVMGRGTWRMLRESPGFSQRFTGTIADGGDTINGQWELRRDDIHWDNDLRIIYRRQR